MSALKEVLFLIKLRKQIKNLDMKNWKTTLMGVVNIALVAGHFFLPNVFTPDLTLHVMGILNGLGLVAASDAKTELNK